MRVTKNRFNVIPALMRMLDILELLSGSDIPLESNEISRVIGVPQSTTYRILRTLVHRGYVTQDIEGRFRILDLPRKFAVAPRTSDPASIHDPKNRNADSPGDHVVEILHSILQTLRHRNENSHDRKILNGRNRDRQH